MKARRNRIQIWLLCAAMLQAVISGAQPVTQIAAGYEHSLFLKSDGSLWVTGWNRWGQLGDGTYNTTNRPEQIVANNVTAIAAGDEHSLFLKNDGSLWAVGTNFFGQLGDGTYNMTNRPEQIVASNVTAIAAGGSHNLFLKSDGSLWAMGNNQSGELGDGTNTKTNQPEQIVADNVTAIAAGSSDFYPGLSLYYAHSLFLKSGGSLWAMGENNFGQLGDGTYNQTNRPEMIVASNVTAIAANNGHSLFLKSDGSLWAMGYNGDGQLGDGTYGGAYPYSTSRSEQILAGFLPGYNQICCQPFSGTNMQLSFVGNAGVKYALDRSSSLSPPNWISQATNPAGSFGALVFTNAPDATTNNFWRIRSVP